MSTVVDIEKAIDRLRPDEFRELMGWFEEKQAAVHASASVFALYDKEEGEGVQWHE